jgi:hypothetical protein
VALSQGLSPCRGGNGPYDHHNGEDDDRVEKVQAEDHVILRADTDIHRVQVKIPIERGLVRLSHVHHDRGYQGKVGRDQPREPARRRRSVSFRGILLAHGEGQPVCVV